MFDILYDQDWPFQFLVWILFVVTTIAVVTALWIAMAPLTILYLETFNKLYCMM